MVSTFGQVSLDKFVECWVSFNWFLKLLMPVQLFLCSRKCWIMLKLFEAFLTTFIQHVGQKSKPFQTDLKTV